MKLIKVLSVAACTVFATPSFAGGMAVIDTAAIANAKVQFSAKIAQMVKELEEAKRLYNSVNGFTNQHHLVAALNDPKIRELLGPEFMRKAMDPTASHRSLGHLAKDAEALTAFTRVTPKQISAEDYYRTELDRLGLNAGRNGAVGNRIIQNADERLAGLEQLRLQLGEVGTQKEMDALRGRIQIETAMLQNDMNRIQGLAILQNAQSQLNRQRATEGLLIEWQKTRSFWEKELK